MMAGEGADAQWWEDWSEYQKWLGTTLLGAGRVIGVEFCILLAIVTLAHIPEF